MLFHLFRKNWIFLLGLVVFYQSATPGYARERLVSSVAIEYSDSKPARLIRVIASKLGCELDMVYAPFARRLVLMEEGKLDFVVGLYKLPEREAYIYFIDPPYKRMVHRHFFLLKDSPIQINVYEDLYGLKIGTKIGSKYFRRFDQDSNIEKIQVSTLEQNFEMLLLGRVDAVIFSYEGGISRARKMGIEDKIKSSVYFNKEYNPVYIGISRKSPLMHRKKEMEEVLQDLIRTGQI